MKKMQMVALAFAVLFAFSAITSASAFALTFEKAKFLINGADIAAGTTVPIDTIGELLFENVLNGSSFTCSELFEGTAGPNGAGSITKVFSLTGVEIKELPSVLACTNEKTCEKPEASPDGLPFKVEAEQDVEDGKFWVLVAGSYEFTCTVLGIKIEELCVLPAVGSEVTNLATDFEAAPATEPKYTCSSNAEESALTNIAGNLTSSTSGNLSVSLP